ncbi:MAG TPA: hypothetical protein DCK99_00285 [Blastocatellia bacterium]|nr:hypothetical protein [Blastocatellia bacterium]
MARLSESQIQNAVNGCVPVWTLTGTDPSGGAVEMAGQTSDVVRRQPEGTWLLVIDIPYGAEAAND